MNKTVDGKMDLRRRNLLLLKRQWEDDWQVLAKKLDVSASYLSQIQSGHRPFSERTARQFEDKLKLKEGWFDLEHSSTMPTSQNDDAALLSRTVDALDLALKGLGKDIESKKRFFRIATFVYEDSKERGAVQSEAWLQSLLRLILEE